MVKLTEDMVVARTRVTNLATVKKLNCWVTIKKCIYFFILIFPGFAGGRPYRCEFASVINLSCLHVVKAWWQVSIVRSLGAVEFLSLPVNSLVSLQDFQHCCQLQELFVRWPSLAIHASDCFALNVGLQQTNLWPLTIYIISDCASGRTGFGT